MITEIGLAAGDIWHYLDKYGESSFSKIVKGIKKPKDIVFMSIGWLAREGHVVVTKTGNDYSVKLRNKE